MPEGGIIHVLAENTTVHEKSGIPLKAGRYVRITVSDTGVGIPEKYLAKIFDPYFTTKAEGSGLGLASVYSIIKNHDGYISVTSRVGDRTSFLIYLPASQKEVLPTKKVEGKPIAGKGRVLVMDDEELIRDVAGRMLHKLGYGVEYARDGAEAIEMYKKARDAGMPFDAILMDLTIPGGMGGREAIQKLLEIDPDVKAIVSSGYSDDSIMSNFKKYGFSAVIAKPYVITGLSKIMHEVITETCK
jgi:CheY-like chemotaxis protein